MEEPSESSEVVPRGPDFARLADVLAAAAHSIGAEAAQQEQRAGDGETAGAGAAAGSGATAKSAACGKSKRDQQDLARQVAQLWPQAVGPEIAANASPVYLNRGRLVVSTSSAAWAQTLHLMSEEILVRLNERLSRGGAGVGQGGGPLSSIVFRHAGWEKSTAGEPGRPDTPERLDPEKRRPQRLDPHRRGLSREQEEALAAVSALDLPEDLKQTMLRAMRAAFVREGQDSVRS